jgi:hypothetical protein
MFDLFDFQPVDYDPFKQKGSAPLAVQVADADRAPPTPAPDALGSSVTVNDPNAAALTQAAAIPTSSTQEAPKESLVGKIGGNIIKNIADLTGEGLAHYAGNQAHPIENRLISAGLEEGSRMLDAVPNALHQFISPMYGEGHVPQFNTGESGADYAGAGINLASLLQGPGGEGSLGAGWNPKALEYLKGLKLKKPPMLPETDAMVQHMIGQGPDYAKSLIEYAPNDTPGKGYAAIATNKHIQEELAKPKPPPPPPTAVQPAPAAPPPSTINPAGWSPGALNHIQNLGLNPNFMTPADTQALLHGGYAVGADKPWLDALAIHTKETTPGVVTLTPAQKAAIQGAKAAKPVSVAQPGTGLPVPAGTPASVAAPKVAKPLKAPKTVKSTPLSAEQALGIGGGATDAQLSKLFSTYVGPLDVPTMKPYDPTVTGLNALSHETAPGTSGQKLPFNPSGLPMDQASVMKRMKEQGFAPIGSNWLFWRGIGKHGPYSWDSASVGYKDPYGKTNEPGLFLHPDVSAKGKPGKPPAATYAGYEGKVNPHVIRADNPLIKEWKSVSGHTGYSSPQMQKAIKDAWAKGHDALLLKNISDQGGLHDQMIVRSPNQLRHPHAAFDPKYKDTPNLLAARGTRAPLVVEDQDQNAGEQ